MSNQSLGVVDSFALADGQVGWIVGRHENGEAWMTPYFSQPDHKDLIRRLAMMLNDCLDLLDAAAERERRREEGKRRREITMQQRARAARDLIAEAEKELSQ